MDIDNLLKPRRMPTYRRQHNMGDSNNRPPLNPSPDNQPRRSGANKIEQVRIYKLSIGTDERKPMTAEQISTLMQIDIKAVRAFMAKPGGTLTPEPALTPDPVLTPEPPLTPKAKAKPKANAKQ